MIRFAVLADSPKTCMDSLPHPDVTLTDDIAALTSAVISGRGVLAVEGADKAAVIDIKSYPLRSVDGSRSYLYPLIPFNGRALSRLFLRRKK